MTTTPPGPTPDILALAHLTIPAAKREEEAPWNAFLIWLAQEERPRGWPAVLRAIGKDRGYISQLHRWSKRYAWSERAQVLDHQMATTAHVTGHVPPMPEVLLKAEADHKARQADRQANPPARKPPKPARGTPATAPTPSHTLVVFDQADALLRYVEAVRSLNIHQLEMSAKLAAKLVHAIDQIDVDKLKPGEIAALVRAAVASSTAAIDQLSELEGIKDFLEERARRADEHARAATAPGAGDDPEDADYE